MSAFARIRCSLLAVALLLLLGSRHAGAFPEFVEFQLPSPNSQPYGIALGGDGNMWFAEGANRIGRITPAGTITEFPIPTAASQPLFLALGADGNIWFTESAGNQIGRVTPSGVIDEFPLPNAASLPFAIAAGPDNALWFTEQAGNRIGRITTAGVITEFTVPTASSAPTGITAGPDGNLWFTERDGHKIGRLTTAGVFTEFVSASSGPLGIVTGPDGNLWYARTGFAKLDRITTAGSITHYSIPPFTGQAFWVASAGGSIWLTQPSENALGRATPLPGGGIRSTALYVPSSAASPYALASDGNGDLWFTESAGNAVVRLRSGSGTLPTATVDFTGLSNGAAFTSVTVSGFTTTATSAGWSVSGYGVPSPSIQFQVAAGASATNSVQVTHGGALFRLGSVDLYSSTTSIPYVFTGSRNGVTVFTQSGNAGQTSGNFVTRTNPHPLDTTAIDTLDISLTNTAFPCCANPMGLDNIVVCSVFGDPPVPQTTTVRALDFQELRDRIDAQRVRYGLSAYAWTDTTLTAGATPIAAAHVAELRSALNDAYVAHAVTAPAYTDPVLTPGTTTVKAVHITELRTAVETLEGACFRLP